MNKSVSELHQEFQTKILKSNKNELARLLHEAYLKIMNLKKKNTKLKEENKRLKEELDSLQARYESSCEEISSMTMCAGDIVV